MAAPPSLRFTLITGLVALQALVLCGVSFTVYERSSNLARASLQQELETRARTLAGILEIDEHGPEFEISPESVAEYQDADSPAFATIYDSYGKAIIRSPSLVDEPLSARGAWREGGILHEELDEGPHGTPCAAVTHSFIVSVDAVDDTESPAVTPITMGAADADAGSAPDGDERWTPPTTQEKRHQIVVALDSRPRDAALASLSWFLGIVSIVALSATAGAGMLLARYVLRPVRRMTVEATHLSAHDPSRRLVPTRIVQELRVLGETLNAAFDRLSGALSRQRRFTADASHELRTPVSVLISNCELLLRRERSTEEYVEALEMQHRVAGGMRGLVEDLLVLARSDAGESELTLETCEVSELVAEIAEEFGPLASEKRIEFASFSAPALSVRCDRAAMLRVLQNLVSNAIKFTPPGGRAGISSTEDARDVRLEVWDTGPGIPESDRERVFERFFRVRGGGDRNEGAGLGLAIARAITRAHGGELIVEDGPDGGAKFVVVLPRPRAREREELAPMAARTPFTVRSPSTA